VHNVKNSPEYALSINSSVRSQRKPNLQPLRPRHVYKFLPQQYHASVPTYTAQRLKSHDPSAGIFNLSFTVLWLLDSCLYQARQGASLSSLLLRGKKNYLSKQKPLLNAVTLLLRHVLYRGASTVPLQH
jgi:hypothetical protein